jgi:hypothetical protein
MCDGLDWTGALEWKRGMASSWRGHGAGGMDTAI